MLKGLFSLAFFTGIELMFASAYPIDELPLIKLLALYWKPQYCHWKI